MWRIWTRPSGGRRSNPDILTVLMVVPERMSLTNLYLYIRHLSENHQKTQRYEIALWKKLIYPVAALVMMALALPFGYMHDRSGNVSVKVFAGVMLGVAFPPPERPVLQPGRHQQLDAAFRGHHAQHAVPGDGCGDDLVGRTALGSVLI